MGQARTHSLPCPPEHWVRFSTLLDAALDLPDAARPGFLLSLAGADALLRPSLDRVLHGTYAERDTFMDPAGLSLPADADFAPGDMIGPYRLEALIGTGGMGQVWRAARDDEGPQRKVALKLPHPEMLAGTFRQRFRRERDVLAALSHPNIASLYDAGVSAGGHPFLALELVAGEPITEACRRRAATLDCRVELVGQMLDALSYAHARLIVHRDIKPTNVMLTPDGAVKLLDFGIAKLLSEPAAKNMLTTPILRLATAGYAAPEQHDGDAPVTVAADLFSAGVLLFELCTGVRPWRVRAGEAEAPLASARADAAAAGLPPASRPDRVLRGDLDAIVAKALAAQPGARYASADAFARDLRRWRDGLPVSARRIGRAAIVAKTVRRHPAASALAAILVLSVLGGSAGITWQARRAERQATRANAIKDFMIGLFEQADPRNGQSAEALTALDLLDRGAASVDGAFPHDRPTEIAVLDTLGGIYDVFDDGQRAERSWGRSLDLARAEYGATDPRVVESTFNLVRSDVEFQHENEALRLLDGLRGPLFGRYGAASIERAQWFDTHALALRTTHGGRAEAIAEDRAAIAIFQHFQNDVHYTDPVIDLSDYLYDGEQYAASLAMLDAARDWQVAHHQYDAVDKMMYVTDAAGRLEKLGRFDAALAAYADAEGEAAAQFGRQSVWYQHALIGRAQMLSLHGDRTGADALFRSATALLSSGAATAQATYLRRTYGAALARDGRVALAIPLLETALAETEMNPHDEGNIRRTQSFLGDAYDQVGRTGQARALLAAARAAWMADGPAELQTLAARERWGRFLLDTGDTGAATQEFRAVLALAGDSPSAPAALAEAGLARMALAAGDPVGADGASAHAIDLIGRVTTEYDTRIGIDIVLVRAASLLAVGRLEEAGAMARAAVAQSQRADVAGSRRITAAQALIDRIGLVH